MLENFPAISCKTVRKEIVWISGVHRAPMDEHLSDADTNIQSVNWNISLGIQVYISAWAFDGSVGRAIGRSGNIADTHYYVPSRNCRAITMIMHNSNQCIESWQFFCNCRKEKYVSSLQITPHCRKTGSSSFMTSVARICTKISEQFQVW